MSMTTAPYAITGRRSLAALALALALAAAGGVAVCGSQFAEDGAHPFAAGVGAGGVAVCGNQFAHESVRPFVTGAGAPAKGTSAPAARAAHAARWVPAQNNGAVISSPTCLPPR